MCSIIHYYRKTEPSHSLLSSIKNQLKFSGLDQDAEKIESIETESCFNVLPSTGVELNEDQTEKLEWLLAETFEKELLQREKSTLNGTHRILEFGPRMTFTSAFSSNATSICNACNIPIQRLELSKRYCFTISSSQTTDLSPQAWAAVQAMLHDRMTEQLYPNPLTSFDHGVKPTPVKIVPILERGRDALEEINNERGLGFDDFDLDYYTNLFKVRKMMNDLLNSP
mmetsp:Transcript_2387/g.3382  ORF Transcript_2387/g.3382 Transcript_2387/m.3382 type:complete len:226 (-) Transcript_2387:4270-4947(-)